MPSFTEWPHGQLKSAITLLFSESHFFHGIERGDHESLCERHSVKRPRNSAEYEYLRQVRINLVGKVQSAPMSSKIKNWQSIRHVTNRPTKFKKFANTLIRITRKEFTPHGNVECKEDRNPRNSIIGLTGKSHDAMYIEKTCKRRTVPWRKAQKTETLWLKLTRTT